MMDKIYKLFFFLTNIFTIVKKYPYLFLFFIVWIVLGIPVLRRILKKIPIPEGFSRLKIILTNIKTLLLRFKLFLIVWVVAGLLLLNLCSIKNPKFIFEGIRNRNEIYFTVVNPSYNIPIKIVDIKLEVFPYVESTITTRAMEEQRFDLYVILSGNELLQTEKARVVLSNRETIKSLFPPNQTIKLNDNDSASFQLKLYGNKSLSESKFRIIVDYINIAEGKTEQITSNKVYIASKERGAERIEHIDVVNYEEFIKKTGKIKKTIH